MNEATIQEEFNEAVVTAAQIMKLLPKRVNPGWIVCLVLILMGNIGLTYKLSPEQFSTMVYELADQLKGLAEDIDDTRDTTRAIGESGE